MACPLAGQPPGIKLFQSFQHGNDVLTRHTGAGSPAHGKNDPLAAGAFQHVERSLPDFLRRAPDADFQRVHVAHQAHAVAHTTLHFAYVLLLAPIEHVEAGIRQMVQAGVHFGVVVVDLDPVRRKGVADALQVGVREFHVVVLVDEADNVVEDHYTPPPITLCCAFSQSMTTRVQRSMSRWAPSGSSTRSIMKWVVPRTKPAVQRGPREVTMGRM